MFLDTTAARELPARRHGEPACAEYIEQSNHWRASRPNEGFDKSPKESFGQIPAWFTPFINLFSSGDIPLIHIPLDDDGGNIH